MKPVDTHCHIHDPEFFSPEQAEQIMGESAELEALLLVGTSLSDSKGAVAFAKRYPGRCWASIGIHPHQAASLSAAEITQHCEELAELATDPVVRAVGECGFDYYYNNRSEVGAKQKLLLEKQLEIAEDHDLPVSFHVRAGFDDFWPVYERYSVRGVLHSFTDTKANADRALAHGLLIGINGIATFTKDEAQRQLFKHMPLGSIVLETDAPFLTPHPIRGTINVPRNVTYVTTFLAELRGEDAKAITAQTTRNARGLFRF